MGTLRRRVHRKTAPDQLREEFDRFASSSSAELLRLAYLVVWDLAGAEDLVQECYVRVARRWPRVRAMERPDAYTRRVLFHLAIDDARHYRRRRDELDRRGVDDPVAAIRDTHAETLLAVVDLRHELVDALGRLAPRQRAVLVLRYFADMTEDQAAEVLGCSVGTVKSTASRALERLREHYDVFPQCQENGHHRPRAKASDSAATRA